jgi:hypothetical protein
MNSVGGYAEDLSEYGFIMHVRYRSQGEVYTPKFFRPYRGFLRPLRPLFPPR